MAMRHSGLKIIAIFVWAAVIAGCSWFARPETETYDEREMAQLATLTRTVMNIVRSDYIGKAFPAVLDETRIVATVTRLNTDFSELKLLDHYDMVMVSDGKHLAAVVWDPKTDRKLLQDLRCTSRLDEATWRESVLGHEFTLGWQNCGT
jgi:hypothetical protein